MAITKEYARGTIIAVQAKATVSVGDPDLLEYSWFKDGVLQSTVQTGETATILVSAAATYHVVVSHPKADSVRSDDFIVTLRDPQKILRLIYQTGSFANIDSSTLVILLLLKWLIGILLRINMRWDQELLKKLLFLVHPLVVGGEYLQKNKILSLDITLRGSPGGDSRSGDGGVGTLRRNFEKSQLYTLKNR